MILILIYFKRLWIIVIVDISINRIAGVLIRSVWWIIMIINRGITITSAFILCGRLRYLWCNISYVRVWIRAVDLDVFVDTTYSFACIICLTILCLKCKNYKDKKINILFDHIWFYDFLISIGNTPYT